MGWCLLVICEAHSSSVPLLPCPHDGAQPHPLEQVPAGATLGVQHDAVGQHRCADALPERAGGARDEPRAHADGPRTADESQRPQLARADVLRVDVLEYDAAGLVEERVIHEGTLREHEQLLERHSLHMTMADQRVAIPELSVWR